MSCKVFYVREMVMLKLTVIAKQNFTWRSHKINRGEDIDGNAEYFMGKFHLNVSFTNV